MAINFIPNDSEAWAHAPALQIQTIREPRELQVSPSCLAKLAGINQQLSPPTLSVSNPIHRRIYLNTGTGCPARNHIDEVIEIACFSFNTRMEQEMLWCHC